MAVDDKPLTVKEAAELIPWDAAASDDALGWPGSAQSWFVRPHC